jgi:hypothetical protein
MIDAATDFSEDSFGSPAAAFIFSELPEAGYIMNAINADITCVNNFPAELYVGPRFSRPTQNFQGAKDLPRYTREMFEDCKPMVLTPTVSSEMVGGVALEVLDKKRQFQDWIESAVSPLKGTGQKPNKDRNIFFDGLLIGGTLIIASILALAFMIVRFALKRLSTTLSIR